MCWKCILCMIYFKTNVIYQMHPFQNKISIRTMNRIYSEPVQSSYYTQKSFFSWIHKFIKQYMRTWTTICKHLVWCCWMLCLKLIKWDCLSMLYLSFLMEWLPYRLRKSYYVCGCEGPISISFTRMEFCHSFCSLL